MRLDGQQTSWKFLGAALCTLAGIVLLGDFAGAGGKSDTKVKVSVTAGAIAPNGRQSVTVTLLIDKGWHVYANPVKCEDFESVQTVIKVNAAVKPAKVEIQYPAGKLHVDKDLKIQWMEYSEKVEIPVIVHRAAGDTSPLELDVTFSACDAKNCLLPATVKKTVK